MVTTNVVPGPVVVTDNSSVGSTLLGLVVQALTWIAFGFCFAGGWHLMEWLISKA